MKNNVMECAVNYYEVVNFVYENSDFITERIIEYYKNYIFNNIPKEEIKIKEIDIIIKKYLNDSSFNSYIKNNLDEDIDFYYDLDLILINLYNSYILRESRKVAVHRWL